MAAVFQIEEMPGQGFAVLLVRGDLEFEDRPAMLEALGRLQQTPWERVVVDFTRLTGLSSLYIGTLVDFALRLQAEGRGLACALPLRLRRIADDTGLSRVARVLTG